ncbi:MAG TPA: ATP phosphoribosyltransferase regulatory subunit [Clostridiales bacterium]|nr:ATP phosphoribosyltransferase regulatory subunit [Clostridiales bacterium]
MRKYYKITPEGTKDFLFEECTAVNKVSKIMDDVFASKGYNQVFTPSMEFFDTFALKHSGISQEDMFILTDKKGRLMVLRPDSTLPIARMVATRLQSEPLPLRLSYNQILYRNNRSLAGRSNEVRQAGMELLGVSGKRADLELITAAIEAMQKVVPDFRIELGHAIFFRALVNKLPISDYQREEVRLSIESKNYSALNSILDELEQTDTVTALRKLPRLFGGEEVFEKAYPLFKGTEAEAALYYLKEMYEALSQIFMGDKLIVDLGLVQRNDYYSGIIFSGYVEGSGDAVLVGGRYDELLSEFQNPMPAAGFGINVHELANMLLKKSVVKNDMSIDILVHGEDGFEMDAINQARQLSMSGSRCEVSTFETQIDAVVYAKKKNIPRVYIVSETTNILDVDK